VLIGYDGAMTNPDQEQTALPSQRKARLVSQCLSTLLAALPQGSDTCTPLHRHQFLIELDNMVSVLYYAYPGWIDESDQFFRGVAEEMPTLESSFQHLVQYGADPSLIVEAVNHYFAALDLTAAQRTQMTAAIINTAVVKTDELTGKAPSPVSDAVVSKINPDPSRFSTTYEFITVTQTLLGNCVQISAAYAHQEPQEQDIQHWLAQLLTTGVLTVEQTMFLHLTCTDRSPKFRALVPRLHRTVLTLDTAWKRELLVQSCAHSWFHHPQRTLDYSGFAEMAQDGSLQGTPASIVSMMMVDTDNAFYDERSHQFNTHWAALCARIAG
jgi:hypothetical protein